MKKSDRQNLHIVAASVLGFAGILHAVRVINGWPVIIGPFMVPMWLSIGLAILAITLATLLWKNA